MLRGVSRRIAGVAVAVAALAGGAGALILTAAPADAALSGLTEIKKTTASNLNPGKVAIAECPPDTVVIGGGFQTSQSAGLVLDDMAPINSRQFRVSVQAADPQSLNWSVTAMAYCAKAPKGYEIVRSAPLQATATFEKQALVFCPAGKQVIGAGAQMDGSPGDVVLDEVLPVTLSNGRQLVTVKGFQEDKGVGGNWRISAFAVCSSPLPGHSIATADSGTTSNPTNQAQSTCPSGSQVISTAFDMTDSLGEVSPTATFRRSNFKTVVHTDAAEQLGGSNRQWSVVSYAICASSLTN